MYLPILCFISLSAFLLRPGVLPSALFFNAEDGGLPLCILPLATLFSAVTLAAFLVTRIFTLRMMCARTRPP